MLNISLTKFQYISLSFLLFLTIALFLFWLAQSDYFLTQPDLFALAISSDLLITIPLIYFLIIRKKPISKFTVIPVTVVCLAFGFLILPSSHHRYLDLFYHYILPFVELGVIGSLMFKTYKGIRILRKEGKSDPDFMNVLRNTTRGAIANERIRGILNTEIAFIYYALFSYRQRKINIDNIRNFSYHRENGLAILVGVFIFILFAESFIVHILVMRWSIIAAWILTAFSLYGLIFLLGQLQAAKNRPIQISSKALQVKFGLFGDLEIPWDKIATISFTSRDVPQGDSHVLEFLSGHNIIITFNEALTLKGLYGISKKISTLAFFVDDSESFATAVRKYRK